MGLIMAGMIIIFLKNNVSLQKSLEAVRRKAFAENGSRFPARPERNPSKEMLFFFNFQ